MTCDTFRDQILDLDGNDTASLTEDLMKHMEHCSACRVFHEDLKRAWSMLDSHPEVDPSPGFNRAVWHKIEARRRESWMASLRDMVRFDPRQAAAAAAVLVGALAVSLLVGYTPPTPHPALLATGPAPMSQTASPALPAPQAMTPHVQEQHDATLLRDVEDLVNTDESEYLSTFQEWDTISGASQEESHPATGDKPDRQNTGLTMATRDLA